jgi:PHP family Zn ribbon phosphoesterase
MTNARKQMGRAIRNVANNGDKYAKAVVDITFAMTSLGITAQEAIRTIAGVRKMPESPKCDKTCCESCYYKDSCQVKSQECDKDCEKCGYGFTPEENAKWGNG